MRQRKVLVPGLMWQFVVCVATVCVARGCGLVLVAEVTETGLLPCEFLCLARDGPCNWSVRTCRFSRPCTVNHTTVVVRLRKDIDHHACQTFYRLGTLAYTQSFEVGLKVTALHGSRVVDSNLRSRHFLEALGKVATTTPSCPQLRAYLTLPTPL